MGRERDNPHQSQRNVVSNHHGHPVISEGSARRGDLLCERRSVEKALQRRVHVARVAQVGQAHQAPRHRPGRPLALPPPVAVLGALGGGLVGAAPGRRAYERAEAAGLLPNPHLVVASN